MYQLPQRGGQHLPRPWLQGPVKAVPSPACRCHLGLKPVLHHLKPPILPTYLPTLRGLRRAPQARTRFTAIPVQASRKYSMGVSREAVEDGMSSLPATFQPCRSLASPLFPEAPGTAEGSLRPPSDGMAGSRSSADQLSSCPLAYNPECGETSRARRCYESPSQPPKSACLFWNSASRTTSVPCPLPPRDPDRSCDQTPVPFPKGLGFLSLPFSPRAPEAVECSCSWLFPRLNGPVTA